MKNEMNYARVAKRKIGLLLMMLASALWMQAEEYDYPYLVFTNTEGALTAFQVNDLTMHINGTQLDVTNNEGTVHFTLTDLSAMQFSVDSKYYSSPKAIRAGTKTWVSGSGQNAVYTYAGGLTIEGGKITSHQCGRRPDYQWRFGLCPFHQQRWYRCQWQCLYQGWSDLCYRCYKSGSGD